MSFTIQAGRSIPVELDLWNGTGARLPFELAGDGQIRLHLTLAGFSARMVALWNQAEAAQLPAAAPDLRDADLLTVQVFKDFSFSADQRLEDGSTRHIALKLPEAIDWREHRQLAALGSPGTYQLCFSLEQVAVGKRYFLCFDRVCDRAEITINGLLLPPLLVMPWRCELTSGLRAGENTLTITVTPTLRNALIAYGKRGAPQYRHYRRQVSMPSGLIGPVRLCQL